MLTIALMMSLAAKPVVMVTYFDNQTNRPEYDVMKKGLADLLITDLVAFDGVTVVERERLEAVLTELKLQQTKAFDPATRQKLGKLVGARYIVSGSMIGVAPEFQVVATLVDASSSTVVVTAKVHGPPDKLFDLEQELVGKLTASIDAKLTDPTVAKKLRGIDVDTVLAYSKGLDLSDQGRLEDAQRAFQELLAKKPIFYLPREKVAALVKRMEESVGRKEDLLSSQGQKLLAMTETWAKEDFTRLSVPKQAEYLTYKAWRSQLMMLAMRPLLAARDPKERPILRGNEAKAAALFKDIYLHEQSLWEQTRVFLKKNPGGATVEIPDVAKDLGLEYVSPLQEAYFWKLTSFALLGDVSVGNVEFSVWPRPIELDQKLKPEVEKLLLGALDRLFALRTKEAAETAHHPIFYSYLKYYSYAGRTEDGVALLQKFLDSFPTSRHFEELQGEIKLALGVTKCDRCWHPFDWETEAKATISACGSEGAPWHWLELKAQVGGAPAMLALIGTAEKSCGAKVASDRNAKRLMENLYEGAAKQFVIFDDCALAKDYASRYCKLDKGEERPDCGGGPDLKHCLPPRK